MNGVPIPIVCVCDFVWVFLSRNVVEHESRGYIEPRDDRPAGATDRWRKDDPRGKRTPDRSRQIVGLPALHQDANIEIDEIRICSFG